MFTSVDAEDYCHTWDNFKLLRVTSGSMLRTVTLLESTNLFFRVTSDLASDNFDSPQITSGILGNYPHTVAIPRLHQIVDQDKTRTIALWVASEDLLTAFRHF